MKNKRICINLLILMFFSITINDKLFSAGKNGDPIDNSFIINSLKMESDNILQPSEHDQDNGEIIFDNTFDDNLTGRSKSGISHSYKKNIKKNTTSDKRFHLTEYRIKKNESIWKIAKKSGISFNKLMEINNLKNPELLKENDIILLPSTRGIFYKIRKGDTLTVISRKFKTEVDVIAEHNNIDARKIIAGKKIFIPDAVEPVIHEPLKKKEKESEAEKTTEIASTASLKKNIENNTSDKLILKWPIHGPITSGFGIRTHPFSGDKRFHCGLDIGAEEGTIVRSAGEGKVIFSGWKEAYGNIIVVSHKNSYITIYAHNEKNLVDVDEKVKMGQKIALSGKTGAVTGAHLHFEIRKGIVPLNPSRILK